MESLTPHCCVHRTVKDDVWTFQKYGEFNDGDYPGDEKLVSYYVWVNGCVHHAHHTMEELMGLCTVCTILYKTHCL